MKQNKNKISRELTDSFLKGMTNFIAEERKKDPDGEVGRICKESEEKSKTRLLTEIECTSFENGRIIIRLPKNKEEVDEAFARIALITSECRTELYEQLIHVAVDEGCEFAIEWLLNTIETES